MNNDVFLFLIAFGLFVVVPVVSMLLKHQRTMAELIHSRQAGATEADTKIAELQAQIESLKSILYEHAIQADDQRQTRLGTGAPPPMPQQQNQRIGL